MMSSCQRVSCQFDGASLAGSECAACPQIIKVPPYIRAGPVAVQVMCEDGGYQGSRAEGKIPVSAR